MNSFDQDGETFIYRDGQAGTHWTLIRFTLM
jgi:hypothetical protein